MRASTLQWLIGGSLPLLTSIAALAQAAPPIKPGLWEVHMDRQVDGRKMPDMSERLAKMSPQERAMFESMMKRNGAGLAGSGGGNIRICIDRDSLAKGDWRGGQGPQGDSAHCKIDYKERSARLWRWHSVCTDPAVESDGEATFHSADSYAMKVISTSSGAAGPRKSELTMRSKWLGADCGDVKPMGNGFGPGRRP